MLYSLVIGYSIIAPEEYVTMIEETLQLNRWERIFLKKAIRDDILMNGGSSTSFSAGFYWKS